MADAVQVDDPVVSLTHLGAGRYDIDDIIARLQPPAGAPAGDPPRFAFYNIRLSGGQVDFNDEAVGKKHELRDLQLAIPFLSNLKSQRDVQTVPRLAFKLNGSSFDTAAEGTPFAQTRKTDATLTLRNFDVKPYLGYMPASLPFRLQDALLNADVQLAFEQTPAAVVKLSGVVTADKVRLLAAGTATPALPAPPGKAGKAAAATAPASAHELLAFDQLRITMDDVRPLDQIVKLSKVELTAPVLHITRDRAGRLNVLPAVVADAVPATKNIAAPDRQQGASGTNGTQKQASAAVSAANPWKIQVASVAVRGGSLNWLDETLASPAEVRLAGISLDASAISVPFAANAPLRFSGTLGLDAAAAPARPGSGREGKDDPRRCTGRTRSAGLQRHPPPTRPRSSPRPSPHGRSTWPPNT